MLDALRKRYDEDEQGFTLIELLVVVIIIGILAAIAIPVFLNQRQRAWVSATQSDMRNAAVVMEEEFSDTGSYAGMVGTYPSTETADNGVNLSDNVTLVVAEGAEDDTYTIVGSHENLDGREWTLDSTTGVITETTPE